MGDGDGAGGSPPGGSRRPAAVGAAASDEETVGLADSSRQMVLEQEQQKHTNGNDRHVDGNGIGNGNHSAKSNGVDDPNSTLEKREALDDDKEAEQHRVSPEESANWLSRLTFWWLEPLMKDGWKKALEQEDLPPLPSWDDSKAVSVAFAAEWAKERERKKEPNLTKTLFRAFRYRLWVGGILQLITVLLQLTPPIFLNSVLLYIQGTPNGNFMYKIFGTYFGYYAAAALLVVPTIRSLVEAQFNHVMFRLGVHVKTALVEVVYAKSLRLSNSARQNKSVGEIVTLMQVDTEKVSMTTAFLHVTWSALLQVFLNLALLIYFIGWSALTGYALLIITIPTQGKLVSLLLKMQRKILLNTGKRVKVVNEVLQGMRVVKCYAWELPFKKSVSSIREVELKAMKARVWLRAVQSCLMLATPTLIMVVTFAFYSGVAKQSMNAAVVFTALALFNGLRVPLMMYPFVINGVLSGYVSLQRIGKYLDGAELKAVVKDEDAGDKPVALTITDGSFRWASAKPPEASSGKDKKKGGPMGPGGRPGGFPGGGPPGFAGKPSGGADAKGGDAKKGGLLRRRNNKGEAGAGKASAPGNNKEGAAAADGKAEEIAKPFELHKVNLSVPRGALFAVVGPVGSGKTSLVSAILGEMEVSGGIPNAEGDKKDESGEKPGPAAGGDGGGPSPVHIYGTVSYCSQQAWIMNASLRENILFGHEFEEDRYNAIIEACSLNQDLSALPDGDRTEIGERGINLSGGQKQRVSLARAVYADTDIVLLDDPLSAVDAHVGAHLFDNCINGILKGKTRIFVTNQLNYVPAADAIAVISRGTVAEQGTYQDLMAKGGEFARLMHESGSHRTDTASDGLGEKSFGRMSSLALSKPSLGRLISRGRQFGGSRARMQSISRRSTFSNKGTLVEKEHRARGTLKLDVYWKYWTETSKIVPLGVLGLYVIVQAVDAFSRYWLAYWTKDEFEESQAFYLGIYAALALVYTGFIYFRTLGQAFLGLWTAKKLHAGMLSSVLQAPMAFFDVTPVGRILNRFSADQAAVDETLPFSWSAFLNILFSVFGTIIVISIITPIFIAVFVPVACLYFYVQQIYRRTARELKRLDAVSKSPVYQQFTETLNGLPVIRAYGQEERFLRMCDSKLDTNNCAFFLLKCCDRWLSVRLELMGNTLVCAAAMLAVSQKGTLFAGFAGIAIDYALQITATLGMLVRQMTDTENQMNGVERMLEYRDRIEHEAPGVVEGHRPDEKWPAKGDIQVQDLSMRYRPNLPLVLKQVSLSISGGERIGVVGRTGSGKSSLMLCLFRLVEPAEGRVCIDGLDISTIGLYDLRSRLSIIPQDPVLFSGTVRSNLDPFNTHSDSDLWEALEHAHLKEKITNLPQKLEAEVVEYGENFSVGERQLLCLARVLLRRNRILVMDEATSSVDFETDRLIQATIRTYMKDATMLIIAHRINTVIDASRILVLADGEVAEFNTPASLLEDPNGRFTSLVEDTGEQTAAHLKKIARGEEDFFASYSTRGSSTE